MTGNGRWIEFNYLSSVSNGIHTFLTSIKLMPYSHLNILKSAFFLEKKFERSKWAGLNIMRPYLHACTCYATTRDLNSE